jgi:hypothetical protein
LCISYAWNITNSDASDVNSLINWDEALKRTTYSYYGVIFIIEIVFIHLLLKKNKYTKTVNRILAAVFILSSPSITSWNIAFTCGGAMGNCQRTLDVITPVVMSINPLYISISVFCATIIVLIYSKIYKVSLI